jgi:hypothetical protein
LSTKTADQRQLLTGLFDGLDLFHRLWAVKS